MIELYKQPKTKKERIRLVIVSIGVDVMMRFMSSVLSELVVFICFLCYAKEGRVVENIESDVACLKILTTMQKS